MFPDQFHLSTLNEFLEACAELHSDVKIKNVLGTLIEHITLYAVAEDSPGIPEDVHLFTIFSEHADKMINSRTEMPTEEIISIQVKYNNFKIKARFIFADCFIEFGVDLLSRQAGVCKFCFFYYCSDA